MVVRATTQHLPGVVEIRRPVVTSSGKPTVGQAATSDSCQPVVGTSTPNHFRSSGAGNCRWLQ
jgi:hypothetical protein